jgi:peptide deformylase
MTDRLDILTYPDRLLKKQTKPIEQIDGKLQQIIATMAATMYQAPGIGLAANQVGIDQRLLIYDIQPPDENRALHVLINPSIVSMEGEILSENEGCLSVPDFRSDIKRAALILVEGYDREGNPVRFEAEGLHAIVLQHEIDHLNGKLIIDRISSLKRELFKRRFKKKSKQQ